MSNFLFLNIKNSFIMKYILLISIGIYFFSGACSQNNQSRILVADSFSIVKSNAEWKKQLSEIQFDVLRKKNYGTAVHRDFVIQ